MTAYANKAQLLAHTHTHRHLKIPTVTADSREICVLIKVEVMTLCLNTLNRSLLGKQEEARSSVTQAFCIVSPRSLRDFPPFSV